ncbi:hypothetical protein PIB30_092453 [Stylosanthes scabra]|uniref:Disease resistance protein RPS4B/Roq1-like leucine-rich repeats domain-containing protein n=1 Tax=Stylosanthes scabra TaxID=79078 RepID=A0ABU6SVI6_9FABA|nr:hypothetical protein [Stylosanthes scabra]
MGREIVKQEAPKEVGERSRLWLNEDVVEALSENTESRKIEGIKLDCCEEASSVDATFEKMKKLRILIVQDTSFSSGSIYLPNQLRLLDWKGYPLKSFPPGFFPKKIAAFNLSCSHLVLEKPFQKFECLTYMNFSGCQSITHFPDVSGTKNLRELILNSCTKLVKVDESVGLLPNLLYLSASKCTELKSFVPRIYLPSLKYLSFDFCIRLEHFPDIVEKMDKPLMISMKHTAIRELPHSFANLSELTYLDMTSCKELQNLPCSLFMLPNFVTLRIGGCAQLRESLKTFKGSHSIAECWPSLRSLHLSNASLSDEDLLIIMQSFPNLEDLNVSSNCFVSLPERIKESTCLRSFDVSYCLMLREIPELPSSVQKVDARHCNSLTSNTLSMLWCQVHKEINKLEVVLPKTEIPKWWDYCSQGGSPMFWARGKFPIVAMAFVFDKLDFKSIGLHLLIDGEHVQFRRQKYHNFRVAEDHVLLCDLRVLFSNEEWEELDARIGHDSEWRTVQVKYETDMVLRAWGMYVYKNETNVDNIQFCCPYPESSWSGFFSKEDKEGRLAIFSSTSSNMRYSEERWTDLGMQRSESSSSTEKVELKRVKKKAKKKARSDSEDGDVESGGVWHAPFSESLQTVVANLNRVMAPTQDNDSFSEIEDEEESDYSLEWFGREMI